jgi:hypothetical protein
MLKEALINKFLWEATFSLQTGRKVYRGQMCRMLWDAVFVQYLV